MRERDKGRRKERYAERGREGVGETRENDLYNEKEIENFKNKNRKIKRNKNDHTERKGGGEKKKPVE